MILCMVDLIIQTSLNIYFSSLFMSLQPETVTVSPHPQSWSRSRMSTCWNVAAERGYKLFRGTGTHSYNETQSEFEIVPLLSCVELFMHSGGLSTVPRMCRRKLQLWSYPYAYGFKRFIFKPFKSLFKLCHQEFFQF